MSVSSNSLTSFNSILRWSDFNENVFDAETLSFQEGVFNLVSSPSFRKKVSCHSNYDSLLNIHSDNHQQDDLDLIALYKERNDVTVVGVLFKRYKHLVYGVCLKYLRDEDESKDALMQVFEKLIVELKRHEIGNFKAWLHTVTKNHCLMIIRSAKSKQKTVSATDDRLEVVEMNSLWHPENSVEKEQTLQRLEKTIQQLNDEQRKCIELFYLEEKSYVEVSSLTGFSLLQVKSYIQNGKRNLKILMEKNHAG
jgi:RNA polymerase sigma factor (sigma-70 family)